MFDIKYLQTLLYNWYHVIKNNKHRIHSWLYMLKYLLATQCPGLCCWERNFSSWRFVLKRRPSTQTRKSFKWTKHDKWREKCDKNYLRGFSLVDGPRNINRKLFLFFFFSAQCDLGSKHFLNPICYIAHMRRVDSPCALRRTKIILQK